MPRARGQPCRGPSGDSIPGQGDRAGPGEGQGGMQGWAGGPGCGDSGEPVLTVWQRGTGSGGRVWRWVSPRSAPEPR